MKSGYAIFRFFPALFATLVLMIVTPLQGQWSSSSLSQAKAQMGAAAYGSRVYFAGGTLANGVTNKVEIYDAEANAWTFGSLSVARAFPGAAALSGRIFFAGGVDWSSLAHFSTVDIFDTLTQQWSTASLSVARTYVQAVSAGSKVFFAGGYKLLGLSPPSFNFYKTVDIYDADTDSWSAVNLSQARAHMGVAAHGNLIFFAGGQTGASEVSDRVDIYNLASNTWTTGALSEPRGFCAAVSVGNYVLIAGGVKNDNSQSDRVDIYNVETGQWSVATLSEARCFSTMGAAACSKAFFAGGGELNLNTFMYDGFSKKVDVFDAVNEQWSTDNLPKAITNQSVVGSNHKILVAGGISNQIFSKSVDIFSCTETVGTPAIETEKMSIDIFPNPSADYVWIKVRADIPQSFLLRLTDLNHTVLKESSGTNNEVIELNTSGLPAGLYLLELEQNGVHLTLKKLIKY